MSDLETEATPIEMPPAAIQAEEAFLGSLLINPDLVKTLVVNPSDFYITRNRWIYEAIRAIANEGGQADILTVNTKLEEHNMLASVGGPAYLMGMINNTPTAMHAEQYAELIKDKSQRRRLINLAGSLAKSAYDPNSQLDQVISSIATELANTARPKGGAQHASVFASRHYDRIDQLSSGDRVVQRIPTGFIDFDRCLNGGLRIPEMLLLAGKPGLGKTKFIFQLAFQMGQCFPGAVYEMETDEDQIMDREISRRTRIHDTRLETGKLEDAEWPLYTQAIETLSNPDLTKVYLDFGSNWTTAALRADLARLKAEYDISWYMVDYLKFLRDRYGKDETERLNHISGQLKQINRELNLASVVIHSMNKKGIESDKPDLTDQSGGADISFDTDKSVFMMPHVPKDGEQANDKYRTFFFRKSRSRLSDVMFTLEADKEFPAFRNVATASQTETEPRQPVAKEKPEKRRSDPGEHWSDRDLNF
jgi:replicative DNA helicase